MSVQGLPGEPLELAFGEGAEFTNDSGVTFQVLLSNPRLIETVAVTREREIYVDSPESRPYFLFVRVQVANEGDSAIDPPSGLTFEADGESIDRTVIRTPEQRYRDIGELAPGEQDAGIIAFPAPDGSGTGTVSLKFQRLLESPPARWAFDFSNLPREGTDLTRDELGDPVTVEAGDHAYEFTPTDAWTSSTYTGSDGTEHTAPDGSTFVMVEATAENVGEVPVKLPTPYDVRLGADDSIARGSPYEGAEPAYEGRVECPTSPGGANPVSFCSPFHSRRRTTPSGSPSGTTRS
ncbi:MAG: hypothetical protein U5K37_10420 [Natrialbaceae archaeon]|nr:hypothetical protein [Natrialbaceae archaeon]